VKTRHVKLIVNNVFEGIGCEEWIELDVMENVVKLMKCGYCVDFYRQVWTSSGSLVGKFYQNW